jgi:hypothetical protein
MRGRPQPFRLVPEVPSEHLAQIEAANMLRKVLRPGIVWTAVDHANAKDARTGAIRKARGARPGIPDFLFWEPQQAYAIEFKVGDGVLSDPEEDFIRDLLAAGVRCKVCWGPAQVFDTVFAWGLCRPQVRPL